MFLMGYIFHASGMNVAISIFSLLSNQHPPFCRGPEALGPLFFYVLQLRLLTTPFRSQLNIDPPFYLGHLFIFNSRIIPIAIRI